MHERCSALTASGKRCKRYAAPLSDVCRAHELRPFAFEHFVEWAGRLILDGGDPWEFEPFQLEFVDDVFGGYREAWFVVPEGNGKTTLLAGLVLYHCQHREAAAVAVAASSREQGGVLYQQAAGLVTRSGLEATQTPDRPSEPGEFRCLKGHRRIRHDATRSRVQIMAADDRTGDGIIPTLCLLDELHGHKDLALYRTWLDKRSAQLVVISTARVPGSDFEATREEFRRRAERLTRRRGSCFTRAHADGFVLHEWAVAEGADVHDLELVAQANPFSHVTPATLVEKHDSPSFTEGH